VRRIALEIGGASAQGVLLDDLAPATCDAVWALLPIHDRGRHVQWCGNAWRTEGNYSLSTEVIENKGEWLEVGDIVYYSRIQKIAVCYGIARWQGPERGQDGKLRLVPRDVTIFARLNGDLTAFMEASRSLLFEGMKPVTIRRLE
jgi:hypothetical protein